MQKNNAMPINYDATNAKKKISHRQVAVPGSSLTIIRGHEKKGLVRTNLIQIF